MKSYKLILAICLGITLCSTVSCNFSPEELRTIVRKEAGKDDFRDSKKWGKVVTKTLQLEDFTRIDLQGNADIKLTQGDETKVEAYGNEKAISGNDIYVKDGTLTIALKETADKRQPSIKIIITTPTLERIDVAGTGDIELKDTLALSNDLCIDISGAGDVEINRLKCQNFSLRISGAGDISAEKIKCKGNADVLISGAGDMNVDMKAKDISVLISGAGEAKLDVKCQNLNVKASGTSDVELKGECAQLTKQSGGMASIDSRKLTIHEGIVIQ